MNIKQALDTLGTKIGGGIGSTFGLAEVFSGFDLGGFLLMCLYAFTGGILGYLGQSLIPFLKKKSKDDE